MLRSRWSESKQSTPLRSAARAVTVRHPSSGLSGTATHAHTTHVAFKKGKRKKAVEKESLRSQRRSLKGFFFSLPPSLFSFHFISSQWTFTVSIKKNRDREGATRTLRYGRQRRIRFLALTAFLRRLEFFYNHSRRYGVGEKRHGGK